MAVRAAHLEVLVTADTDRAQRGLEGVTRSTGGFARVGGLARVGALALGAGLAGAAVGAWKAVGAASDLSETLNKVRVVFTTSARAVTAWGANAVNTMGMSQQAALDAAAIFGTFGESAGLTGTKLAGFSEKLVQAAADLSSFHNVPIEESLAAIQSGLAGETEPLRRFGVLLDDATLRQEALRQGLVKTTNDALTPQQRTLAAQAVILRKLGPATGDYARTSGGLANTLRRVRERLANVTAHIGQFLLPMMGRAATAADEFVGFLDKLAKARDARVAVGIVWDSVARSVAELYGKLRDALVGTSGRQLLKLPTGKVLGWEETGTEGLVSKLRTALAAALANVDWGDVGGKIAEGVGAAIDFTGDTTSSAIQSLAAALIANSDTLAEAGALLAVKMVNTLMDPAFWLAHWQEMLALVLSVFPAGKLASLGGRMVVILMRPFGRVGIRLMEIFGRSLIRVAARMPGWVQDGFLAIELLARNGWRRIQTWAVNTFLNIGARAPALVQRGLLAIWDLAAAVWARILGRANSTWQRIAGYIAGKAAAIGNAIQRSILGRIATWITRLGAVQAAFSLVSTTVGAIVTAIQSAVSWVGRLVDKIGDIDWPDPPSLPHIPGFASGALAGVRGGVAIVGEQGPELVDLPPGARVRNARQTREARTGGGGVQTIIVNAYGAAAEDPDLLSRKVAWAARRLSPTPLPIGVAQ